MTLSFPDIAVRGYRWTAILLALLLLTAPISAQRPAKPAGPPPRQTPRPPDPTFDTLLATDAYKLYGEVRNVGQLLSTGGAGEIVDPIIKLADPGKEFKSIVSFLKKNSEALLLSRLLFATWPARTDVPTVFVAIEFPTAEDAAKFAPKLETFLPTVLAPVTATPEPTPAAGASPAEPGPQPAAQSAKPSTPANTATPQAGDQLPFVITRSGNLVCISEKAFKFEKLHPPSAKALFQDQNFRTVHDKFSTEPVFLFLNVALEDKSKPQPSPTVVTEEEPARVDNKDETTAKQEPAATPTEPEEEKPQERTAVLVAGPEPSPTPTPTREQQAQAIASSQIGGMLDALGFGEPQWPDALGLALTFDGNEYIVRALLIDKPGAKLLPIPFVPQLIAGPPYTVEVASVLPEDTEVFLSASIDLTQSYEGMRKEAEIKKQTQSKSAVYINGALQPQAPDNVEPDAFAQFEKKAGFKIKDDLLAALGSELAVAGSLKTLQSVGGLGLGAIPAAKPSPEAKDQNQKDAGVFPIILISVRNRDAVRRLMPKVLDGLGIGEANLLAQTEKRGDAEIVNYAGMFAYGFVGDFVVLSDAGGVRRVVDANVNNQTLSSNSVYRNSRRWQSGRTLGQFYVSPALMEVYHEQIRKEAGSMEATMRDFLLSLNPKTEAITYALSNDGLGTQHELHLPKNLILTIVASISNAARNPPPEANEMIAVSGLQVIVSAQQQYKAGAGKGSYGTIQQLVDAKLFPLEGFDKYGYRYGITVIGDQFEAVATPKEYGKTGKQSFFVDKSGVVRGDDHGGGPATVADKPVQR
jgi:hypothetical protein